MQIFRSDRFFYFVPPCNVLKLSGLPLCGMIDFFRPGIWWKAFMSCIFAEVESPTQALVLQPLKILIHETFFYRASDACCVLQEACL